MKIRLKSSNNIYDQEQKRNKRSQYCLASIILFFIIPLIILGIYIFNQYLTNNTVNTIISSCLPNQAISLQGQCCADKNNNGACDSKTFNFKINHLITNPSNGPYSNLAFNTMIPKTNNTQEVSFKVTPITQDTTNTKTNNQYFSYVFKKLEPGKKQKINIKGQATVKDQLLEINLDPKGLTNSTKYFLSNNQKIEASAREIIKDKKTDSAKLKTLYQYLVENYQYKKDLKTIPNASTVLNTKKGDCDGFSFLLVSQLRSIGIPAIMLYGFNPNSKQLHSWIAAYVNNSWIQADPGQKLYDKEVIKSLNLFIFFLATDQDFDWQIKQYKYKKNTNSGKVKPRVIKQWS